MPETSILLMKAIIAVSLGIMSQMLLLAESPAPETNGGVLLAKRDVVELEFETTVGQGYQVYVKQGEGEWKPHGQAIEGDGEVVTIVYPDGKTDVEFRVETVDLIQSVPASLPDGIDYKLTGIYRLRGKSKACVAKVDSRNQPARTAYFTLGVGESAGSIKVMSIQSEKGLAEIEVQGVALSLSFSGNAFTSNTVNQSIPSTQVPSGKPTVVAGPPKGKVFMGKNDPYYKEAQKKSYTNRYSILDQSTVRSLNRYVRSKPQSIFTPRTSSQVYLPPTYIRPKVSTKTYWSPRR